MNDSRKVVIFVAYIPPSQKAEQTKEIMECIADGIEKVKLEYNDPYIILGGDLNRRDLSPGIADFPDISVLPSGATRDGATLDIVASNVNAGDTAAYLREPLATEDGRVSDHSVVHVCCNLPRLHQYKIEEYILYANILKRQKKNSDNFYWTRTGQP